MTTDCRGFRDPSLLRRWLAPALLCLVTSSTGPLVADEPVVVSSSGGGRAGRLQGSVSVGPELSSRRLHFNLYADLTRPAPAPTTPDDTRELGNVVIYIESGPVTGTASAPKPARPTMRQEELSFVPHVLAIQKGMSVEFPNGDPIFHNVFSLSKPASFDLGRYPKGASRSVRFDKPGMVKVFCHIHSDMSAVIVVLDNPYFATPDTGGRYSIDGLPPGEYTVVGWHERARPLRRTIRIQPGQAANVDFKIPLTEPAVGD
jgi:plastocyanin